MYYTVNEWEQLKGPRWDLFLYLAGTLVDDLLLMQIEETGIEQFDKLELNTKIYLIVEVCKRLQDPNKTEPIYAFHDAAFAAVVYYIKDQVGNDLDTVALIGNKSHELVGVFAVFHAFLVEQFSAEPGCIDAKGLANLSRLVNSRKWGKKAQGWWQAQADNLPDYYLADMDFDMDRTLADLPPDRAAVVKYSAGIDPDYFSTAAPAITEKQMKEAVKWLRRTVKANKNIRGLFE